MSEQFEPITTQEDFQARIDKILTKKYRQWEENKSEIPKDYEELKAYKAESESKLSSVQKALDKANKTIEGHNAEVESLTQKIKGYEIRDAKVRIAQEVGLDLSLADRINGEDEESMRADAQTLAKAFSRPIPLANTEPTPQDDRDSGMRQMLKELGGQ